ncbi:AMP-binding protein [Williamsia maris]|uniref:Acyl-CoA synthetase (AMP-forming)/AMP-acid ligase II n=1 Tax=Williamsia maris TaxID=72806 RepID=A0ABT1HBX4_9NOCA|nr:AMP-binding protein [Williamsia maris]MCP2175181.1 Acyl-CoA synthetase (AMP-forming)/AMP-acid ligase II [Williamsia maris]
MTETTSTDFTATDFNLGDIFETIADAVPDRIAIGYEGVDVSYRDLDERSNAFGHLLRDHGIGAGDHVALYLKNSLEHVYAMVALLKIGATAINVNYRYTATELAYILENSDAVAVLVELDEHQRTLATVLPQTAVHTVLVIGDVTPELAAAEKDRVSVGVVDLDGHSTARDFPPRSGDQHYILYTGGTTGYPKGVVWRHDDFFHKPLSGGNPYGPEPLADHAAIANNASTFAPISFLLAAPLMHGAAIYSLFMFFINGGRLVLQRDFVPAAVLDSIEHHGVQIVLIVGDGMGAPLVEEMERRQALGTLEVSGLLSVTNGGAIWSTAVRDRMRAVKPDLWMRDNFGASETGNDGELVMGDDGLLRSTSNPALTVLDEALEPIEPGSDEIGFIARVGRVPVGYHKDEEKSARTFVTLPDGRRAAVLGDMGRLESDGSVVFLGRGSGCINTGGEKVFAEEVEAAVQAHPAVHDVLVVGVPDPRFGQRVAAVVSVVDGADVPTLDEIQMTCRERIAGYKVPRAVTVVEQIRRSPAGKADYKWASATAVEAVATV